MNGARSLRKGSTAYTQLVSSRDTAAAQPMS